MPLIAGSPCVFGQLSDAVEVQAVSTLQVPARLEVSVSTPSRFDNTDGSSATHVDLSLVSARGMSLGPAAGITALSEPAVGGMAMSASSFDLGLHWRYTLESNRRVDVMAWRRLPGPADAATLVQQRQPGYGARVEMQLTPARTPLLAADYRLVGLHLHLQSGARISLRKKDGKPTVYYKLSF